MDTRKLALLQEPNGYNIVIAIDGHGTSVRVQVPSQGSEPHHNTDRDILLVELVKRWNIHNELVAKLKAIVEEIEDYGFIGEAVADPNNDDENHYIGSPAYQDARALLDTMQITAP